MTDWPFWGTLAYATVYAGFLLTSLHLINKERAVGSVRSCSWFRTIWELWAIYGPILARTCQTATGIGAVIIFYDLMRREQNGHEVDSVDMFALFCWALFFMLVSRVAAVGAVHLGVINTKFDHWYTYTLVAFDLFWICRIELYINEVIDRNALKQATDNTTRQEIQRRLMNNEREAQLYETLIAMTDFCESVLETTPQLTLQAVFVLRTLRNGAVPPSHYSLLCFCILVSCMSLTSKIVRWDAMELEHTSMTLHLDKCASGVHFVWRFCAVSGRMAILSLVFACVSGWLFSVQCLLSMAVFAYLKRFKGWKVRLLQYIMSVGCLLFQHCSAVNNARVVENFMAMCLVSVFIFVKFGCKLVCAETSERMARDNYVVVVLYAFAWLLLFCEQLLYRFVTSNIKSRRALRRMASVTAVSNSSGGLELTPTPGTGTGSGNVTEFNTTREGSPLPVIEEKETDLNCDDLGADEFSD